MANIDNSAFFKIGYGLYAVTCKGARDNALIVNTVTQVASNPTRISVCISKQNYSHDVIKESGKMNVCCLDTATPFSVFETLGFASGRDRDKLAALPFWRSQNGLAVLRDNINAFMSLEVVQYIDLDSHGMFICTVSEAHVISDEESMTYSYYHTNVKPTPTKKKSGYVCKICGYVYEGEPLPPDFICPICKHGAEDFEKLS